jgi:phosphoribosylformylglycinamidine synthase subunit PurQ / glutaminase
MPTPRSLVLRAPGTNCDEETAAAWRIAGAHVETRRLGEILERPQTLDAYQILTFPGGFSYGDDLGAGRIFATRLGTILGDALRRFRDRGGLLLGICNGFQILVKAGLLPGPASVASLTHNASGRFESRWVRLLPTAGISPFLTDAEPIELPVAHGEGQYVAADASAASVILRYADAHDRPTEDYPSNPNGSPGGVAGLCDPTGRIFGLMPHPERHVDPLHHPRWTRLGPKPEGDGLRIFRNAVAAVR